VHTAALYDSLIACCIVIFFCVSFSFTFLVFSSGPFLTSEFLKIFSWIGFSYHNDCPVVQDCDLYSYCTYSWTPQAGDATACVQQEACNWLDCSLYGLDDASCAAWCVNSSLSLGTCLDCSGGTAVLNPAASTGAHFVCTEIANITESECTAGVCSLDATITSSDTCALLTLCSVTVTSATPGLGGPSYALNFTASDAGTCSSFGACQSAADIQQLLDQDPWLSSGATGVCLSPTLDNFCNGNWVPILEGCPEDAYLSQAVCESNGFVWRTIATDAANCMITFSFASFSLISRHSSSWMFQHTAEILQRQRFHGMPRVQSHELSFSLD
jgi:hypothetical protein